MTRYKMTRNDVQKLGLPIVKLPAWAMKNLLCGIDISGYNSGIYGWNWDAYIIDGVVFCTGYRNIPGFLTQEERELVATYEEKAHAVWRVAWVYEDGRYLVDIYLDELCEKIKADRA